MLFCSTKLPLAQTMDVFTSPRVIRLCAKPHREVSFSYVCQDTDENLYVVYIACPGKFHGEILAGSLELEGSAFDCALMRGDSSLAGHGGKKTWVSARRNPGFADYRQVHECAESYS
jgi:hypothetical protein